MEKEVNLFLVATAYQYISALNLCFEKYDQEKFENHIFYWEHNNICKINEDKITGLNGFVKSLNLEQKEKHGKDLALYKCKRFFFYQENSILNKYIAFNLKRKGTEIHLGPDGTKPYAVYKKDHEFLSMIKDTLRDYKYLISNKMHIQRIIPSRFYKYGSTYLLDSILLQYPDIYDPSANKTTCKISELPELSNNNIIRISKSFNLTKSSFNQISGNIIYFNQPLWTDELIQKELEIIHEIVKIKKDKNIYIKLHPGTSSYLKKKYSEIEKVILIDDQQPSEIYLAHLKNTICVTGWSAAIMHKLGENNTFFYLYPLFEDINDKILSQIHFIGFPHIRVLNNFLELKRII